MKMKEKFKRFWSMDVHNHEGFTLVELIIVIAILAILSSVAVAGYSSYIEKANKQADMTLVSQILNAVELAHYDSPLGGAAAMQLTTDGIKIEDTTDWLENALKAAFGDNYATSMKLKYGEWLNSVVYGTMNNHVTNNGLTGIYGNAGNLSFTEEIPTLMDEIKDVAYEVAGPTASDEIVIGIVEGAAEVTSGWTAEAIQGLWNDQIKYENNKYTFAASIEIPEGTSAFDEKLTVAGVVRAKNACVAIYANSLNKGYDKFYNVLANFSVATDSVLPWDLTAAVKTDEGKAALFQACQAVDPAFTTAKAQQMAQDLWAYYEAEDSNGKKVFNNDAAAYLTMMDVVNDMKGDFSDSTVDEYFEAVQGPVSAFQQLVMGKLPSGLTTNFSGNGIVLIFYVDANGMLVCNPASASELE